MAVGESGEGAGLLMGAGEVHVPAAARPVAARPAPRGRLAGLAGAGLAILLTALAVAALADVIAPRGYDDQDLAAALQPPAWAGGTWSNPLGTDPLGRDVLSRIVYGARTSLVLALGSVLIAAAVGVTLGLVSGWAGGRVDAAIMSAVEAQLSLPYLLFAIAFMALLGSSLTNLVIVLVLRSWVVYAQLVRVSVLSMKTREFVTVAVALGARGSRILFRHIAPNVIAPALVISSFQLAELIIVESSLGFLGLGVPPPTPSWGNMLSQGREYLGSAWWLVTFPGLAIILTVLGANLFGDALRDALDPRLRTRARLAPPVPPDPQGDSLTMDFGLFIPCHRFDASISVKELYGQVLEMVALADETGFTTAWFPEHHLVQYYASPSPLMWMVKAAATTRRIRVGAAILVIPYYNPLRLAGEIGMADVLCDGRLEIGVGRGAFEYEFDRFGITEEIGAARLREGMEIVEGLLTQDDFSYEGTTCSFGPATAVPKPLQQPHPPIWVAARSPDTIAWALKRGYNLLTTPWRDPFSRIQKHHEQVMQIAASVGVTKPPTLAVSRMTYVGATDGDALEAMADIQVSHRIFTRLFRNQANVKGGFTLPEPVDDEYSREQLLANLVAGSPETCVEKVRAYEALGVSQFILYGAFGPDHSRTMASLRRFAEQVMPHFRKGFRS